MNNNVLIEMRNTVIVAHKTLTEHDMSAGIKLMGLSAFQKCLNILDPDLPCAAKDKDDALIAFAAALYMVHNVAKELP